MILGHMASMYQTCLDYFIEGTMREWVERKQGAVKMELREELNSIFHSCFGKYIFACDVTKILKDFSYIDA